MHAVMVSNRMMPWIPSLHTVQEQNEDLLCPGEGSGPGSADGGERD